MTRVCEGCQARTATAVVLAGTGPTELVDLCPVCLDTAHDLVDLVVEPALGGAR
jgi:hypothetical protein